MDARLDAGGPAAKRAARGRRAGPCRNYAAAAEAIPRAIGLSGSTVSRAFIQASATKLRELQERDLDVSQGLLVIVDGGVRAGMGGRRLE